MNAQGNDMAQATLARGLVMKGRLRVLALVVGLLTMMPAARAADLLVFVRDGCPWCARFEAEIAPIYGKTTEGACAHLRYIDIAAPRPAGVAAIVYTPTFVVVEDGREVGRVTGYPGQDFFWDMLDRELAKLRVPCPPVRP